MYSNSKHYASYTAPFNKETDDIDWDKLEDEKKYDEDGDRASLFMNAVYHGYKMNALQQFTMIFLTIQDEISDRARGAVPISGQFESKVGNSSG